ncbi:serine/arginine repetitive matrix protein 1-like [Neophocaena asiaeorientalis asiaeorientalis]|uniref:Serine/arginine repetitive matrix protein 1-like n=1 Tax=Neophocaena asiaeorientalis asiaeorientalis TaxID=1706337 RepID=A0A341CGW3_NEOAA|nr:serine/arginine repetitive matrix protein 1-like [Neophocaena asiaeorientalis asiaeorientalis]
MRGEHSEKPRTQTPAAPGCSRVPAPRFSAARGPGAPVRHARRSPPSIPPRRRCRARGHSPTTVSRLPAPKATAAPVKHSPGAPHPNRGAPPALTWHQEPRARPEVPGLSHGPPAPRKNPLRPRRQRPRSPSTDSRVPAPKY